MANIFEKHSNTRTIFKNEKVLYPEHMPDKLPGRDSEINTIAYSLKPVLSGGRPRNVFIYGPPGVGKTVCVKHVLEQLEDYSSRAKYKYINCWEYNTRHSILSQITNFLGFAVPRRGVATDEIYNYFIEALKKSSFSSIIILDEIDQILNNPEGSKLLYDLLRTNLSKIGIIAISNNLTMTFNLDARVRSSLTEESVVFKPYTPMELKEIINERVKLAFFPMAVEKEIIDVAAGHAAKLGGDARIAISSIWQAGKEAEKENSPKVSLDNLKQAFKISEEAPVKKMLKYLTAPEKKILKMLVQKEMFSTEIYEEYNKDTDDQLTDRRLRTFIARLETLKLVDTIMQGKEKKVKLIVPKEMVDEELKDME